MSHLGNNCKVGNLKRLAGIYINDGVCGLIRQYTWNLTNCCDFILYNKLKLFIQK